MNGIILFAGALLFLWLGRSIFIPLLAAVFGGTAMGVGLGLVLAAGATTGGVDLAATSRGHCL